MSLYTVKAPNPSMEKRKEKVACSERNQILTAAIFVVNLHTDTFTIRHEYIYMSPIKGTEPISMARALGCLIARGY